MYFGLIVPAYGYAFFAPGIIRSYGFSQIGTQLHSVPPWAASFIFALVIAYFSDFFKHRFLFTLIPIAMSITGFAILLDNPQRHTSRIRRPLLGHDGHILCFAGHSLLVQSQPWRPSSSGCRYGVANWLWQHWRYHSHIRLPGKRRPEIQTRIQHLHWVCLFECCSLLHLCCRCAGGKSEPGQGRYGFGADGV